MRSIVVVFAALLSFSATADSRRKITLGVGSQKLLTVPGIQRVAIGNAAVADVKTIGKRQVMVVGKARGNTTLLVWNASGKRLSYIVSVRRQDPNTVIGEIQRLLGDIEGVTARMVGDRVYLDGQAYTQADADRIEQVIDLYPNVNSFVKIAPNAKKLVAKNLNAAFQKAGLQHAHATVVGSTIFLEGSVESQQDMHKAKLITKAIGEKVENLLAIGIKRMILSEVQFVEIRHQHTGRYGIKYPLDITGSTTASFNITKNLFPDLSDAKSRLNTVTGNLSNAVTGGSQFAIGFQNNNGYTRLLAQPKLVCASGEKAEFLAGGEVPIPLITNNQFTVQYKPYGIILKLQPTADRNGNIQTDIEAEVSGVDQAVAVSTGSGTSVPGFRNRKVKTNVTVRNGETIALSGVFFHDQQKSVSKIPLLGHIPILGELFKNRGFDTSRRELVIFVTPRIVNPHSKQIQKMLNDVKSRYRRARSEVNFNIFD